MRKVLFGLMGVATTVSLVTASAFALFSASATVSGISFAAGDADISLSGDGTNFSNNLDAGLDVTGLVPGFGMDGSESTTFYIANDSDFDMTFTGQLTAANGWNDSQLKDYIEVAVVGEAGTLEESDWMSLAEWNASPMPLDEDDSTITAGDNEAYTVYARMMDTAPSTLEGKSLTDVAFTVVGTQVVAETPEVPAP